MASGSRNETIAKKPKLETDVIVQTFYRDIDLMSTLTDNTKILQEWNAYCVCLLKITHCNGMCKENFTNAFCATERYQCLDNQTKELDVKKYSFASIFKFGIDVLKSFSKGSRPKRKGANIALTKLLYFLLDEMQRCSDLWHGLVDIMMGVSVKLVSDEIDETEESDSPGGHGNQSSIEVKMKDWKKSRQQIIAQAIVFSFLQNKIHPEFRNHLIPSIGISKEMIVIFFYDCENDMLLESSEMPIFRNGKIVKATVLSLWLTLNYKYFCSGLTKGMLETDYKADFFKHVKSKLNNYKEDVDAPCEIPRKSFERPYSSWTWGGKPEDDDSPVEDVNEIVPDEKLRKEIS